MIVAETERLTIRPLVLEDYRAFLEGYQFSLPAQNRFDEGVFDTDFMTKEWYDGLLARRKREAEADDCYMLNIFRKEDGASLRYCDITPHYRGDFQYARIGYTIHNQFWHQGYATEAVRAMINIAFEQLGLHRLEAHVNLDNPASKRVLLKAGFRFECVREKFILEDGVWTDNEVYYVNRD